ncbi:PiggyBac transposable element-derived protein 3, partial [Trichinella spiralis]
YQQKALVPQGILEVDLRFSVLCVPELFESFSILFLVIAQYPELHLVPNHCGGMSLVHEGRAYKLKSAKKQKYWMWLKLHKHRQFGIFHEQLSIDEGMVPYYGHHSCQMFIRSKPVRFGYKIWTMSSANGYPYALKIYAGKDERKKSEPLGMKVIEEMISVLERPVKHELYFNNFFASYDLLEKLSDKMIRATGTIRNSRTRKIPIMPVDEVKKKYRGFFDHVCNGTVYACRWNDNAVVTLASNHLTHHPIGSVQRYSQSQQKHVKIRMPEIVRRYNTSMGGVDILDKLLSSYRPRLRSKKWWWNLFSNALNRAVVAAWRLHRELHQEMVVEFILKCTEPCCCRSLAITQGIAPREFHCPVTSGFHKRYHNTSSPSKISANHSDWTKSTSTRSLENNARTFILSRFPRDDVVFVRKIAGYIVSSAEKDCTGSAFHCIIAFLRCGGAIWTNLHVTSVTLTSRMITSKAARWMSTWPTKWKKGDFEKIEETKPIPAIYDEKLPPRLLTHPNLALFPFLNGPIIVGTCKSLSRSEQQRPVMNFCCGRVHQGIYR